MTTQLHLVPRLRMCGPTPSACFHGVCVENYFSLDLNEEMNCNKKNKKILRLRFLIIHDVLPQFTYISLIAMDALYIGNGNKEIS